MKDDLFNVRMGSCINEGSPGLMGRFHLVQKLNLVSVKDFLDQCLV